MGYVSRTLERIFKPHEYRQMVEHTMTEMCGLRTPEQFNNYRTVINRKFGDKSVRMFNEFDLGSEVPSKVRNQFFYSLARSFESEAYRGGHRKNVAKAAQAYQKLSHRAHQEHARELWRGFFGNVLDGQVQFGFGFWECDVLEFLEKSNLTRREKEKYRAQLDEALKRKQEKTN